jgi:16S rRNA (adenine1518-N6/adenine1519-N6)-dimethyltransferase
VAFRGNTIRKACPAFCYTRPAMTRQRLGQHFLSDLGWRRRILETLPRNAGDVWVEIGPGHGEMTQLLAAPDRRIIAIEADARLAAGLEGGIRADAAKWPGVDVISADVLTADLGAIANGRFRVYGNLPYYITSPILHHLFAFAEQIASIDIVVQWEVAARIVSPPGRRDYGYLSAICQFYTTPEIVLRIPPGAFRPPPRVTSALVRMTLPGARPSLEIGDEQRFLHFVQSCFGQKRKTLRNNLRGSFSEGAIEGALGSAGLRSDARAEQLSLTQFAALFVKLTVGTPANS